MATATIDFTGIADSESLGGTALPDWTLQRGTIDIATNSETIKAGTSAALTVYSYDAITPTGDMFIEATVATAAAGSTSLLLCLSVQAGGNCVYATANDTTITITRYDGSYTDIATGTLSPYSSPKTLKFRLVGTTYSVYDSLDNLICSAVDATLTGGKCGVGARYSSTSTSTYLDNIELGDYVAVGLQIDSAPANMTRGSTGSFQISNAATAPTLGNTTIISSGDGLTLDSITGSDPYTLNFTCPSTLSKQHDTTGYIWTITVDAENAVSSAIPLNAPSGYAYTDLVSPVTTSGSILEGYTGDAPVTGDQVVYTTPTSPDSIGFTVGADGEWVLDSAPTQNQTVDRYVIQVDGTLGTEATITYSVSGGGTIPTDSRGSVFHIGSYLLSTGSYNSVQLNDVVNEWLVGEGYSGSLNEMLYQYLSGLGYTGTLNDMLFKWAN